MFIETFDGELVNLDRVGIIRVSPRGTESEVMACMGALDRDGDEISYQLFRGTGEACKAYMTALKERLRGWDRWMKL